LRLNILSAHSVDQSPCVKLCCWACFSRGAANIFIFLSNGWVWAVLDVTAGTSVRQRGHRVGRMGNSESAKWPVPVRVCD